MYYPPLSEPHVYIIYLHFLITCWELKFPKIWIQHSLHYWLGFFLIIVKFSDLCCVQILHIISVAPNVPARGETVKLRESTCSVASHNGDSLPALPLPRRSPFLSTSFAFHASIELGKWEYLGFCPWSHSSFWLCPFLVVALTLSSPFHGWQWNNDSLCNPGNKATTNFLNLASCPFNFLNISPVAKRLNPCLPRHS